VKETAESNKTEIRLSCMPHNQNLKFQILNRKQIMCNIFLQSKTSCDYSHYTDKFLRRSEWIWWASINKTLSMNPQNSTILQWTLLFTH